MLNAMIVFRSLIARNRDQDRRFTAAHSETELRAFERALKRRVEFELTSA